MLSPKFIPLAAAILTVVLCPNVSVLAEPPVLRGDDNVGVVNSPDGVIVLEWGKKRGEDEFEEGTRFELQEGTNDSFKDFKILYEGSDEGSVYSGLSEGSYFYRVRIANEGEEPGEWSNVLTVKVSYLSRAKLFALLGAGFIVVALTAGAIIGGHFKNSKEGS